MRLQLAIWLVVVGSSARARADADPVAARAHFVTGKRFLDLRKFAEAIAELHKAYDLDPQGETLYRLAVAYQLSGDRANAIEHYRKFLATNPTDRTADTARRYLAVLDGERADEEVVAKRSADAEQAGREARGRIDAAKSRLDTATARIAKLEGDVKERTAAREAAVTESAHAHAEVVRADAEVAAVRRTALAAPSGKGRALRVAGLGLMGLGAAAIAGAAWYGVDAQHISTTLDHISSADPGTAWTTTDDALVSEGERDHSRVPVLFSGGALSVMAGVILFGVGESRSSSPLPAADHQAAVEGGPR